MQRIIHFAYNLRAQLYLEMLLATAVATIIFIRFVLMFFGFPQLGDVQTLHIAHMLWGGLLMLSVIMLFLSLFGRSIALLSAIVGGIGFGIFIDELGKFITVNNNYLYQPAIPLMYFIFILLFFLVRHVLKTQEPSVVDYRVNSMEMIEEAIINPHQDHEFYEQLALFLKKSGHKNRYVHFLSGFVHEQLQVHEAPSPHRFGDMLEGWYQRLLKKRITVTVVIVFFVLYALFNAYITIHPFMNLFSFDISDLTILERLEFFSVIIITGITTVSFVEFFFSRVAAYHTLELAVYLSIYLLQFFIFYRNQLSGIFALAISLMTLLTLKYLIDLERRHIRKHILGKFSQSHIH